MVWSKCFLADTLPMDSHISGATTWEQRVHVLKGSPTVALLQRFKSQNLKGTRNLCHSNLKGRILCNSQEMLALGYQGSGPERVCHQWFFRFVLVRIAVLNSFSPPDSLPLSDHPAAPAAPYPAVCPCCRSRAERRDDPTQA